MMEQKLVHVSILGDRGNGQEEYVNRRLKELKEDVIVTVLSVGGKDIWERKYDKKEIEEYENEAGNIVSKLKDISDRMVERLELLNSQERTIDLYNERMKGKELSRHVVVLDDLDLLLDGVDDTELKGYISYVVRELALQGERVGITVYYIGVGIEDNPHAKQVIKSSGEVYVFKMENIDAYGDSIRG